MRMHQITKRGEKAPAPLPKAPVQSPKRRVTFGLIVGNRGFFPGHLAREGRAEMLKALAEEGFDSVVLEESATNYGAIESRDEAKAYAELFRQNRDRIDGIIVTLPNFGDERGVAETVRMA